MQQEVIIISDDEDEQKLFNKNVQERMIQHKLLEASMGTRWDKSSFNYKNTLEGPQQQKEDALKLNILNFFKVNYQIDLEGSFQPKFDIIEPAEFCLKTLMTYGVDFMATRRIIRYFNFFNPTEIKWLDDSNCLIEFPDELSARLAIIKNLQKNIDENDIQIGVKEWYRLMSYYQFGFQRTLEVRYATKSEIKLQKDPNKPNLFNLYENAKVVFLHKYPCQQQPQRFSKNRTKNHKSYNGNHRKSDKYSEGRTSNHKGYQNSSRQRRNNYNYRPYNNNQNNSFQRIPQQQQQRCLNDSFKKNKKSDEPMEQFIRSFQRCGFQPDEQSRSNYSFEKNPNMKQEFMQPNENYFNHELSFRKKTPQQLENSRMINDLSFRKELQQMEIEEHDLSFKKNLIILDDE